MVGREIYEVVRAARFASRLFRGRFRRRSFRRRFFRRRFRRRSLRCRCFRCRSLRRRCGTCRKDCRKHHDDNNECKYFSSFHHNSS
ncbi:MAG TPA: hypothetical protein DEB31_11585 [Clostridiales bacterium]|nr:hypothetical protein [Clostridiales bacterium]